MPVEYVGLYVPLDPSVVTNEQDEWETSLKAARQTILNHLLAKIPNETAFKDKIADASSDAWESFVSTSWEDYEFITLKQRVKLERAYSDWYDGIQNAFAEGGAFETNVTNKKGKTRNFRYPMGAVGVKYKLAWKCAYKAIAVISGDARVLRYFDADDITTPSTVVNVFLARAAKFARATAVPIIVRGLVLAQYAQEAGDTSLRDTIINRTNTTLDNTVKKMIDTSTYPNADIKIEWNADYNRLAVHSKEA